MCQSREKSAAILDCVEIPPDNARYEPLLRSALLSSSLVIKALLMKISVRYFARIREALGPGEDLHFEEDGPVNVGALLDWLARQSPRHDVALKQEKAIRAACDHVMCGFNEALHDGVEVAFFPPVTGG
jgi:molybdopterin synthase sulfur carrier subunit